MNNITDVKYLQAEIASIDNILASLWEGDIITRRSFESRRSQVLSELESLQGKFDTAAEVVLYFGGEPVRGSEAIKTTFASEALAKFQDLVSTIFASLKHELASTGPLPDSKESSLSLVAIAKGSFGFVLREDSPQSSLLPTNVSRAIHEAGKLIELSIKDNDSELTEELANTNARVLQSFKCFTEVLVQNNASFAFETKDFKVDVPKSKLTVVQKNVENIEIETSTIVVHGIFLGATKRSRKFDFEPTDKNPLKISGTIDNEFHEDRISLLNMEYMDKQCEIKLAVTKTTKKNSKTSSTKWVLLDIIGA